MLYQRDKTPSDQELGEDILRRTDFNIKTRLLSTTTKYQSVDIYELHHEGRGSVYAALGKKPLMTMVTTIAGTNSAKEKEGGAAGDGGGTVIVDEKEYQPAVVPPPDRALFIDGILLSSLYGEAAYHEALVHPTLLVHSDPKRVAIM